MLKTKIAVLVSGGGTNLQALLDFSDSGRLPDGEICAVISDNAEAFALRRAEKHGVPTFVVPREKGMPQAEFEQNLRAVLEKCSAEIVVLAGFMRILSGDFVSRYEKRMINVHPSLIPAFCGKGFYGIHVHEAALKYGVKITGATVHYVNSVPDGGEIIAQKAVRIRKNDTPETLQRRVMEQAEWMLLPAAVEMTAKRVRKEKKNGKA